MTACANLAPDYERPVAPIDVNWPVTEAAADSSSAPAASEIAWSEFYGDPRLRQLIALALAHNRDLRSTALNIESARAQYRIVRAGEWPTLNATGARTAEGFGARASSSGVAQTTRQYSAQLGISAFELDFFGRLRNLREQALETFLASEETLRAARITLVAEVAVAYLTLAADQQRLRLAEDTLSSQQTSFELTRRTFELGSASALDVAQAQTSVDTARADIATFRTQVTQDLNALTLLVGRPVERALVADAGRAEDGSPVPLTASAGPVAGLPSELLQRRPDVLAAERSLRATNANIGAARAGLFPSITLTTTLGTASPALSRLFGADTRTWSFIPAITLPIFDAGAARADVRVAEVQRDVAVATYDKTIQTAFREVADALAQRRDIDALLDARQSLVSANEKSYRLSDARYRKGVDSYLTVLDAQRSLYTAQQNLISARLLQGTNVVTLYSVLGGGWQAAAPP
jgi:outer membrane protein, multidrug efflux system